jgi:tRNA G10  N-methylase Trm11
MSKTYAFILGRHPALSVSELIRAVPGITITGLAGEACLAECDELSPGFLRRLGGTIKLVEVLAQLDAPPELTAELMRTHLPLPRSGTPVCGARPGRVIFGISVYGQVSMDHRRALYLQGLELKKLLKEEGRRARYVVSREKQLSSVVVTKNKLIEEGAEFVVISHAGGLALGRTLAVQEFEAYGERDFDRPGRSARRGMLPPKLAQMMINISGNDRNHALIDPFCGSGTVLGEALLLGFNELIGTDLSSEAITDTTAYLTWLQARHPEFAGRWQTYAADVRMLTERLGEKRVGSIVTETYLGPPQSGHETTVQLSKTMTDTLVPLYRDALAVFSKILAPGGSAVIALPIYGKGSASRYVPLAEIASGLIIEPLIPKELTSDYGLSTTPSGGCRYERPDQHLAREVVLLRAP